MSKLIIDHDFLYEMDKHCRIDNIEKCEREIENIVSNLWMNIGGYQELIEPAFITFLQTNLLRPLYICYFSMAELIQHYDEIVIQDSTIVLDIVASYFQIDLPESRQNHDIEFHLIRIYNFNKTRDGLIKGFLRKIYCLANTIKGIDVLYINAGKLDADFKNINNAMNATHIPRINNDGIDIDVKEVISQSIYNIKELNISIPTKIILDLLHGRVYCHLQNFFSLIRVYLNFIRLHHVNLIIISAATHEECLALLAAANMAGVRSLSIGHGYTGIRNQSIDKCLDYQGTINNFEYQYADTYQFKLRMSWFEDEKKI